MTHSETYAESTAIARQRFPFFCSQPVSYLTVRMTDCFWAARQQATRTVSVPLITCSHDPAGGLKTFRQNPARYVTATRSSEMEHIKFMEALATVAGIESDPAINGLIEAWAKPLLEGQAADGYLGDNFPRGDNRLESRWEPAWWSHEDYTVGHYLEAAIALQEVSGDETMYRSAVRAVDNMAAEVLDSSRPYASGHPNIEQAIMRLYGITGNGTYLRLCGWLLEQRGRHEKRASYGRSRQDHVPIAQQRTIEGHAVMAGYLFNGVTHYVGATGNDSYREAVLAVWEDFANHKMYLHGGGGNKSSRTEGYLPEPYNIPPDDTYSETCSVFANFQWAHSLFRLTGKSNYLDAAERMLYNAFCASISLRGDEFFYSNAMQTGLSAAAATAEDLLRYTPPARSVKIATSCCPPNIVKLVNKVGGFFYSITDEGIYVKHYGSSEADIPWGDGVRLEQRTDYPWNGNIHLRLQLPAERAFTLWLRVPGWARAHAVSLNGIRLELAADDGWLAIRRAWRSDDEIDLDLSMQVERITLPAEFRYYNNRAALQRGPIVYCLEEQDLESPVKSTVNGLPVSPMVTLYIPEDFQCTVEHRPELLGGVTVLHGVVRQLQPDGSEQPLLATLIPYAVWGNRGASEMRTWLGAHRATWQDFLHSQSGSLDDRESSADQKKQR